MFKDFFYIPVSATKLFSLTFSAIWKDGWAVFMTIKFMKERTERTMTDKDKFMNKLSIYTVAFILEDLGQVLCQEALYYVTVEVFISTTPMKCQV